MCENSDGSSESVRRRSQPNSRPSGSTRMMCAGSQCAAAKSERAHDQRRQAAPPAGDPAIKQAAEHQLLDDRRQHGEQQQADRELPGLAHHVDHLLHALGLDAELADRDRQDERAQRAEHRVFPVGRPQAQCGKRRLAERRHRHDHRHEGRSRRRRRGRSASPGRAKTARRRSRPPARPSRKTTRDHHGMGL